MKSRITIEVDFYQNNIPTIQIIRAHSDDVRDKLVSAFFETLQNESTWAKILFQSYRMEDGTGVSHSVYRIYPIPPDDLSTESQIMAEQARVQKSASIDV